MGLLQQVWGLWRRYNTYYAHYKENECMRIALEPTFKEFGVDLVFTGCAPLTSCPLAVLIACCVSAIARSAETWTLSDIAFSTHVQ